MSAEYVIATNRDTLDRVAVAQGWRSFGRASWLKPDGTEVRYLHFIEQLAVIEPGDTVHVVGRPAEMMTALKGSGAIIVKL